MDCNREWLLRLCRRMAGLFSRHNIPRAAAGLSYFLMLSVFPALICLYHMLDSFFPVPGQLCVTLAALFPRSAAGTVEDFLRYISEERNFGSQRMLFAALTVTVSSSSAAYRVIDVFMGELRPGRRMGGFFRLVFSFCFSVFFLTAIYLAALLLLSGKWFLERIDRRLLFMNISEAWAWGRFLLLFFLMFPLLALVYRLTAPRDLPTRQFPGALAAAAALVAVSLFFSVFIERSARYPLVYGSFAGLILMMVWLYACGMVLFGGNILNVALESLYREDEREDTA